MNREINIIHLYPDLLNLYGDKGNIASLVKRLEWRGIDANVTEVCDRDARIDFDNADIVFIGGGPDKEQDVVCEILKRQKDAFSEYTESGGVVLAACGGFEILGKYYYSNDVKNEGVGILDIYTEPSDKRLISNVVLDCDLFEQKIVGFENHAGRMKIGSCKPLGRVLLGNGNDGMSGYEGVVYKNVIATYLHGPILPKNPMLCDYVLNAALKKKYDDFDGLEKLDDTMENAANESVVKRFLSEK